MADLILLLVAGYVGLGVGVGVWLAFFCMGRIDPVAAQSPVVFRLMVLPGLVGLWPVMLVKWARGVKGGGA